MHTYNLYCIISSCQFLHIFSTAIQLSWFLCQKHCEWCQFQQFWKRSTRPHKPLKSRTCNSSKQQPTSTFCTTESLPSPSCQISHGCSDLLSRPASSATHLTPAPPFIAVSVLFQLWLMPAHALFRLQLTAHRQSLQLSVLKMLNLTTIMLGFKSLWLKCWSANAF